MSTRETRLQRGRRQADAITARLLEGLRSARITMNVSQRAVARVLGWSHTRYQRFEANLLANVSIADICQAAAVLGLELGAGLYPVGDGLWTRGTKR
jgi:transcriptional regulator with XRE-family HTH domain